MPFQSKAQQGYLHAHPEILGKKGLHEWDEATKGKYQDLPTYTHAHAARKKKESSPSYSDVRKARKN